MQWQELSFSSLAEYVNLNWLSEFPLSINIQLFVILFGYSLFTLSTLVIIFHHKIIIIKILSSCHFFWWTFFFLLGKPILLKCPFWFIPFKAWCWSSYFLSTMGYSFVYLEEIFLFPIFLAFLTTWFILSTNIIIITTFYN